MALAAILCSSPLGAGPRSINPVRKEMLRGTTPPIMKLTAAPGIAGFSRLGMQALWAASGLLE